MRLHSSASAFLFAVLSSAALAQQPRLGVTVEDSSQPKGAKVVEVGPNSPADSAGVRVGDVIVRMGETETSDIGAFDGIFERMKIGDDVSIVVVRDGEKKTLHAKLGEMRAPSPDVARRRVVPGRSEEADVEARAAAKAAKADKEKLAKELRQRAEKEARAAGGGDRRAFLGVTTESTDDGLLRVITVHDGTAAEKAGLQEGDELVEVGGKSVDSPDDLRATIREHKPGDVLVLKVKRGDRTLALEPRLGGAESMDLSTTPDMPRAAAAVEALRSGAGATHGDLAELRSEVARLRDEIAKLRSQLAELRGERKPR